MTSNYFVEIRKGVVRDLMAFIQANDGIELKKVIGIFGLKTGMRSKTILGMINQLIDAGRVTMDGDYIRCLA